MARVFVDSGVLLIAAHSAVSSEPALLLLKEPAHTFLTSPFVYLETVPKARSHRRLGEVAFYEEYFDNARCIRDVSAIIDHGIEIAEHYGVGPIDALHVAAAALLKADELVTAEKPGKSIHRARSVRVVYLYR